MIKDGLSQDIEQVVKDTRKSFREDPVSVTGSMGASAVLYQADGIAPRRDPFYWVLNANLNITILEKVSVPFSAVITAQDKNFSNGIDKFSQPFNQFGISPRYRWLTVHAGFRSLDFSEYSLAGTVFMGGGLEIRPEGSLVSGAAFFGRFVKAIPQGGVDGIVVSVPAYARWGGGAAVKVGTEKNSAELIFLKIRDDAGSIPFDTAVGINPVENQVISVVSQQRINRWLRAGAEIALSMFTKNLFSETTTIGGFTYLNQIYTPRTSTQFNKAVNASLDFTPGKIAFGIKYKRVDPDYQTLGAIFLANDVEEISANSTFILYSNKVNVSLAAGLQQNNLDRIQALISRRFIQSVAINWTPTESLNLNANYSNFSTNSLPVRDAFNDSIRFVQLTQNGSVSMGYSFGSTETRHQVTGVSSYQESAATDQAASVFYNGSLSYNLAFSCTAWGMTASFIYNNSMTTGFDGNTGYGPQFGLNKSILLNKMNFSMLAGFQDTRSNATLLSRNYNYSFSYRYTIDKSNSLRLEVSYLKREAREMRVQSFSESRGMIGYTYNFGVSRKNFIRDEQDK